MKHPVFFDEATLEIFGSGRSDSSIDYVKARLKPEALKQSPSPD